LGKRNYTEPTENAGARISGERTVTPKIFIIPTTVGSERTSMFAQYEDFQKLGKQGFDAALKNFGTLSKGFEAIAVEVADFSKKQFEANSAALEKLVGAKSLDKAVEVQAEFARQSFEGFVAHSTKVGQLISNLTKEAVKPVETAVAQTTAKATK
jgi:phasin family protein